MSDTEYFKNTAKTYTPLINAEIAVCNQRLEQEVLDQFGPEPLRVIESFTDILGRGGKRLRGMLVLVGYDMCGGSKQVMAVKAAAAVEMLHACLLILDDIQDRSDTRRGGPSAHALLREYHRGHKLRGDAAHTGEALAINAATAGLHLAQSLLTGLDAEAARIIKALRILNQAIVVTAHGQTQDMMNEVLPDVSLAQAENVLTWKTAHYTCAAPLQGGMALAGADDAAITRIEPYALATGKAFQHIDDITGTFGTTAENCKNIMDDIREGKRTPLAVYALGRATPADREFLQKSLGDQHLTKAAFRRCQDIIASSGALAYCREQARTYLTDATRDLGGLGDICPPEYQRILRGLSGYLFERLEKS